MVETIFTTFFIEKFKILITAILIYVIIYSLLSVTKTLGDDSKINSLIALITAIIVSFSGVVTYAIVYAINWFVIIIFIVFLAMVLMMFLGVKASDIAGALKGKNTMYLAIAFLLLFSIIIIKSFFAVNNSFDTNNPQNNSYDVNTNYNLGFSENVENKKQDISFFEKLTSNKDLLYIVFFFIGIGIFIMILGK